jgi:hypothetical protein
VRATTRATLTVLIIDKALVLATSGDFNFDSVIFSWDSALFAAACKDSLTWTSVGSRGSSPGSERVSIVRSQDNGRTYFGARLAAVALAFLVAAFVRLLRIMGFGVQSKGVAAAKCCPS